MKNASLTVVGSGIKFLSHLTNEAKAYIEQSDIVLYLVNDPAMKKWLQKTSRASKSLDSLYNKFPLRLDCYKAITRYILDNLLQDQHVCVVLYGHPCVFAQSGLDAVLEARQQGLTANILPGISSEDCLFADLTIDPGSCGCQSFEATDFLIYKRQFDPFSHLILWQIDIIGVLTNPDNHDNSAGMQILVTYLSKYYALEHTVILYEAAQYPSFEPRIHKLFLQDLPSAIFSRISTLYIPPKEGAICDTTMLEKLHLN